VSFRSAWGLFQVTTFGELSRFYWCFSVFLLIYEQDYEPSCSTSFRSAWGLFQAYGVDVVISLLLVFFSIPADLTAGTAHGTLRYLVCFSVFSLVYQRGAVESVSVCAAFPVLLAVCSR
jgi:hypothetical protein